MTKDMNEKGVVMFAAWACNAIAVFTAHFSYTRVIDEAMITPVIISKLVSACAAVVLAYFCERRRVR